MTVKLMVLEGGSCMEDSSAMFNASEELPDKPHKFAIRLHIEGSDWLKLLSTSLIKV